MNDLDLSNASSFGEMYNQRVKEIFSVPENWERVGELATNNFRKYYGCSQSIVQAFMDVMGLKDEFWFRAMGGLQGGGGCGLTCGALNVGFILISARVGRRRLQDGFNGLMPMMEPCHKLAEWFKLQYKSRTCSEISGYDWFDIAEVIAQHITPKGKERLENCARLAGGTAYKTAEILSKL